MISHFVAKLLRNNIECKTVLIYVNLYKVELYVRYRNIFRENILPLDTPVFFMLVSRVLRQILVHWETMVHYIFFIESFPRMCFEGSGCRIGYEPTKMSRDHFWRSISRDSYMEVSALSPVDCMMYL